ncbi:MAG: LamG-like jellyroll fold domain-containing protein [Microgenomates group bacterium]
MIVRSDVEASNLFAAKLKFPADLLQVKSINTSTTATNFIKNWIENTFDNTAGVISVVGGVPSPGYQTIPNQLPGQMMEIDFTAKKAGVANITFTPDASIYRNSDSTNILFLRRDFSVKIENPATPTPTGAPVSAFGKAITFKNPDGKGSNRIELLNQDVIGLNQLNKITAEAWIKPVVNTDGVILMKLKGSGNNPGEYQYFISLQKPGNVVFCVSVTSTARIMCAGGAPELGASYKGSGWYHVAMVFDQGTFRTFINGKLTATQGPIAGALLDNSSQGTLYIGGTPDNISGLGTAYKGFNGDIDEIRFSNNARYAGDFTPPATPFVEDANTLALWHYDGNFADQINRKTGQTFGSVPFADSTIGVVPSTPTPTPTPAGMKGDVNGDGKITLVDMSALLSRWAKTGAEAGKADINLDGVVNTFDYSLLLQILIQNGVIKGAADLPASLQR